MNDETPTGRTLHYAEFYGLRPIDDSRPVLFVLGNCQAESLRLMLDAADVTTVRIPPVHELVASDIPHLNRVESQASLVVSQPIHADYHGLPIGTGQVAERLGTRVGMVRMPVIRFAGLYPFHAIIRPPSDPSLVPPIVAYHDLRTLVEAAGLFVFELSPERVQAIAAQSIDQLRLRERAHDTVVISDLFAQPSFEQMRTINHPGNAVFSVLATRVRAALGLDPVETDAVPPLLESVQAPREQSVVEAFGLDDDARAHWVVDGEPVEALRVREAHLRFYLEHPDAVTAGLERHRDALRILGLTS